MVNAPRFRSDRFWKNGAEVRTAIAAVFAAALLMIPFKRHAEVLLDSTRLVELKQRYGDAAYLRGLALNRLLLKLSDADTETKLVEVNRFFNTFEYKSDKELWGKNDYWQTPFEFFGRNSGDCEDYVISKYFALRKLGIDDSKLYLTYVKAVRQKIAHMVLSYYENPKSVPKILDNYNPAILPATKRKDLVPVYSFNAESLFLSNAAGLGQALPTGKIKNSRWEKLLRDIRRADQ